MTSAIAAGAANKHGMRVRILKSVFMCVSPQRAHPFFGLLTKPKERARNIRAKRVRVAKEKALAMS
jgi:hypothetical protein